MVAPLYVLAVQAARPPRFRHFALALQEVGHEGLPLAVTVLCYASTLHKGFVLFCQPYWRCC